MQKQSRLYSLALLPAALAFVGLMAATPEADAASPTRGPYLQVGTDTSMTVRWRSSSATDSVVQYGSAPGNLTSTVSNAALVTDHEVVLTGLSADTTYYYSVGTSSGVDAGADTDHFFATSPTPGTSKPTRIWVLGDSGTKDANQRAVRDAYTNTFDSPDVWLMLGDNAYDWGTDAEYQSAVFDVYPDVLRQSVLWSTLGNHDAVNANTYFDIFTMPTAGEAGGLNSGSEAYYSFDYGDIHFVCLDSQDSNRSTSGPMLSWLVSDLAATDSKFIIAFWHHPPYSKGSHDSDSETRLIQMRENALPILEGYGVDLVLGGHSHAYERSYLLDGHYGSSTSLDASMILDSGDGQLDGNGAYTKELQTPNAGAVYIVAGSSGKATGGALNHPAMFVSMNELGSLVIDVDGDLLTTRFLDDSGTFSDYFSIQKTSAAICGDGITDSGEQCDGGDLAGATCADYGCTGGTPSCSGSCSLDSSSCTGCPVCDNDGVCETDEDCNNCPSDCASGSGASCGNGVCEAGDGEDCVSCPSDCNGVQSGKPSRRYCCGGGGGSTPISCSDSRCGSECTDVPAVASCCGDLSCDGTEDSLSCELDCGPAPFCGDGTCDSSESACNCASDCGGPSSEICGDGTDNDCDGDIDCDDLDCSAEPSCSTPTCELAGLGESCASSADCCSNKCKGKAGAKTCK